MKLITANKLNRLWQNGFLPKLGLKIDKTKVLTTIEQVSANTNPENIAGAAVAKELNNNLMFPDGLHFYPDLKDGKRGYNTDAARGADTFVPFSSAEVIEITSAPGKQNSLTLTFENPYQKEIIFAFGYVINYDAQYFMYDFMHESGKTIKSISKTETSISLVRSVTSTSACNYKTWVVLA